MTSHALFAMDLVLANVGTVLQGTLEMREGCVKVGVVKSDHMTII